MSPDFSEASSAHLYDRRNSNTLMQRVVARVSETVPVGALLSAGGHVKEAWSGWCSCHRCPNSHLPHLADDARELELNRMPQAILSSMEIIFLT